MFMNVLLQGVWDLHCLVRPISQDQCIESLHFNFRSLCAVQPTLIDGSNRKYSWKGVTIASAASPVNMGHHKKNIFQPYKE